MDIYLSFPSGVNLLASEFSLFSLSYCISFILLLLVWLHVIAGAEIKVVESKKEIFEEVIFVEMECEVNVPMPELAADWWGTKYGFVRGGALGSKQVQVRETVNGERPSENGRTRFSEQDQENLYNMVNVSCH